MFIGSRGIVSYGSHDIPFLRTMETLRTEPRSREEIQDIAKRRIETMLDEVRGTKEEQVIGWNGRGLS